MQVHRPAATTDGAALAQVLAGALSLGLPDPDYITMSLRRARSTTVSAVGFQFNDRNGQDPLPALHAWADRFGVTVSVSTDSEDPPGTWHRFKFEHAGVLFDAYAVIEAAAPEDASPCAVCGHAQGSHWEHAEPWRVYRKGCGIVGCACVRYAGAADVLAASIAAGTPVIAEEDAVSRCPVTAFGFRCERLAGHPMPHRIEGGTEWAGACANEDCVLDEQHDGEHELVTGDEPDPDYPDVSGGGVPYPPAEPHHFLSAADAMRMNRRTS